MKWPSFIVASFAGAVLLAVQPVLADTIVVPLGLAANGGSPGLQLVQLKTSRDTDTLDLAFWNSIKESKNKEDYEAYLEVFPDGAFAPLARLRALARPESSPQANKAAPAADDGEADLVYRILRSANVRAQPRASAVRVGGVSRGSLVTVTGRAAGGSWLRVRLADGTNGFLFAELAEQTGRPHAVTADVEPARPAQAPAPETRIATVPPVARAAEPLPAGSFRDCEGCPEMVPVKAGRFIMGDDSGDKSERPAHPVTLTRDYAIGRFEVTVAQWQACVAAGSCPTLPGFEGFDGDSPARNVSWDDAQIYADWLSKETGEAYRLPSEAEWEFAARGGTAGRFWWGDDVAVGKVSCRKCGGEWDRDSPLLVGSLEANPFGLFDVSGGVAEWTADCWQGNHKGAAANGAVVNKKNCRQRVLRGGSWRSSSPKFLASSSRFFYDADVRFVANGFRVARN